MPSVGVSLPFRAVFVAARAFQARSQEVSISRAFPACIRRTRDVGGTDAARICCASAVARNPGWKAHEIGLSTAARLALAAERSERFGTKLHRWERKSPEKVPEFSRRSLTVHSCRRSVAGARHEPLSRSPLPVLAFRFPVPRSSVLRQGENTRIGARRRRQSAPSAGGSGISDPPHNALVLCLIDSWSMRLRRAGARGPWARLGGADPRIRNTRSPEDSHLLERVDWCASNNDKSIYAVQPPQSGSTFAYIA